MPDGLHTLQHVSGKTRNGLGQYQVDLSGFAILDQAIQFFSSPHGTSALAMVAVYTDKLHPRILLDALFVVLTLHLKGTVLRITRRADAAVCCCSLFFHMVLPSDRTFFGHCMFPLMCAHSKRYCDFSVIYYSVQPVSVETRAKEKRTGRSLLRYV